MYIHHSPLTIDDSMNWLFLWEVLYAVFVILLCLRIIYDTASYTKTFAYLLLVVFVPFVGIFIYLSFGINYRKRKIYSKKIDDDDELASQLDEEVFQYSQQTYKNHQQLLESNKELAYMLSKYNKSALAAKNTIRILINGENKFPEVIKALQNAKHHIHIEYYIYENDQIGNTIADLLIQKAKEGVQVRFIYDDFGSRSIRKKLLKKLKDGGVHVFPFYKVIFIALANRLNYRNHRKIIVIDGRQAFVGGINVSDRYINSSKHANQQYWRDTHLSIAGPAVHYLQYLFLCDWNFCADDHLHRNHHFFPTINSLPDGDNKIVQIAASGPDSDTPTILFTVLQAINLATNEILITTPYFIPSESIIDALIVAALGGVSVKLLVPGVSDSKIVNAAAYSYYGDLLDAGAEIYLYQKGFVHAKTMVTDKKLAMIGTANMDSRSFDLNFEVNALIYDVDTAEKLAAIFYDDIKDASKVNAKTWNQRPVIKQMFEKTARLVSPLL
jgi:cardiolipin synthase